jgi:hypothetical protein
MKPMKEENPFFFKIQENNYKCWPPRKPGSFSVRLCALLVTPFHAGPKCAFQLISTSYAFVRSFVRNSVRWALLKWELVVARLTIGRWGEGVVVGELPSSVWRTADAFLKEFHHPLPSAPLPLHLKTRALPLCSASSRFEFNPKTTSGC